MAKEAADGVIGMTQAWPCRCVLRSGRGEAGLGAGVIPLSRWCCRDPHTSSTSRRRITTVKNTWLSPEPLLVLPVHCYIKINVFVLSAQGNAAKLQLQLFRGTVLRRDVHVVIYLLFVLIYQV